MGKGQKEGELGRWVGETLITPPREFPLGAWRLLLLP